LYALGGDREDGGDEKQAGKHARVWPDGCRLAISSQSRWKALETVEEPCVWWRRDLPAAMSWKREALAGDRVKNVGASLPIF
ncbi:MAG: hypothetical protein ACR2RV_27945, partial [Verrucomicrobiales bacterium]